MALSISSRLAGLGLRDLIMPRSADTGSFGKITTLPSGCTKNFTRSPGFSRRCSLTALGMVAWPLMLSADSIFLYFPNEVIPRSVDKVNLCCRSALACNGQQSALCRMFSCSSRHRRIRCGRTGKPLLFRSRCPRNGRCNTLTHRSERNYRRGLRISSASTWCTFRNPSIFMVHSDLTHYMPDSLCWLARTDIVSELPLSRRSIRCRVVHLHGSKANQ